MLGTGGGEPVTIVPTVAFHSLAQSPLAKIFFSHALTNCLAAGSLLASPMP